MATAQKNPSRHPVLGADPDPGAFAPGDIAIVPRKRSDGAVVRRPVLLLASATDGFVAAKIVSRDLTAEAPAGSLKEAVAIDGCGLHRPSFVLPEWFFFQKFTAEWRRIGQLPTPLFNVIMGKYADAAAYKQLVGKGRAVYGRPQRDA